MLFEAGTLPGGSPRDAGRDAPERGEILVALQANLERGYLESEERFRQIVEGLHDVVWLTDAEGGRVLFVNAAYEAIWGEARETLYADPLAFLERVHPDDRAMVREMVSSHPEGNHDVEYRVVRPSGEVRWVWSRGYPVLDREGRLHRRGTIVEDITERRQIVESHERLVRGFTHDIKNPLGAADGYMALLEMGIHGELNERQAENIRRARASIRAALGMVVQLLEIERAQSGQLAVTAAPADVDEIARGAAAEFRPAALAKRIDLELLPSRSGDSLVVETDAALVRQILANLISNAVKYTQPDGHVSMRAHVASDTQAPWPGRWIAVEVADDGPGIPIAKQGMLFREFTRFDPGAAEGSGIGLAISQRLAFALGAAITFTSTPGVGSTFTLWIPMERSPAQPT
ncbi:MAG TPA: PAS domain-containing sensor histidine kinase [Gemmatimonadaceae bacterium]|nr:PAS domain-containing sensor histidine kinase [Gemmatimonadaceae bacterium]